MRHLEGKVALITGGARGTGAEIARRYVEEGATVVVADVLDDRGEGVASELGGPARFLHLDVGDEAAWRSVVDDVARREGTLDVLVNNAGVLHLASIDATTVADFERVMRVNCIGAFLGTRTCLPLLRAAEGGAIVNVGSIDSVAGTPATAAYTASKFAIRGLTKVTALENGKHGIRANCICPAAGNPELTGDTIAAGHAIGLVVSEGGGTYTPKPINRPGRPADVAGAAVFLGSDQSAFCTGIELVIDGGSTAGMYVDVPGMFSVGSG
jgi:3alpha(or 20beta)-hydroxysteroid dehydrogenase